MIKKDEPGLYKDASRQYNTQDISSLSKVQNISTFMCFVNFKVSYKPCSREVRYILKCKGLHLPYILTSRKKSVSNQIPLIQLDQKF